MVVSIASFTGFVDHHAGQHVGLAVNRKTAIESIANPA